MTTKSLFLAWMTSIAVLTVFSLQASAANITFVNETLTNTTVNGVAIILEPAAGFNVGDGLSTTTDDLWSERPLTSVNGDDVFTLYKGDENDVTDTLNTTISVASGTYKVYAYFWGNADIPLTDDGSDWDIKADLNGGTSLDVLAGDTGTIISTSQSFVTAPTKTVLNAADLWAVELGTFTGTEFTVNVNAGTVGTKADSRTWYDGVGYEPVPEPNSISLCLLGIMGLGYTVRRRRCA